MLVQSRIWRKPFGRCAFNPDTIDLMTRCEHCGEEIYSSEACESFEIHGGYYRGRWCGPELALCLECTDKLGKEEE